MSASAAVSYRRLDGVALITIDDGKVNALSFDVLAELRAALEQARQDDVAIVLTGRPGRFSAGFDLAVLGTLSDSAPALVRAGFEAAHAVLGHPRPVVTACSGHAIAMGLFLLLAGDFRFGVAGADYRLTANEVAIGLTLPRAALEICRWRVPPSHLDRVTLLAEVFDPAGAVEAGLLDATVDPDQLHDAAVQKAEDLLGLNAQAFTSTKLRSRAALLDGLQSAIETDAAEFAAALSG